MLVQRRGLPSRVRPAFSLLECVVVVAVIGVLVTVLVVTVGRSKRRSLEALVLSRLSQHSSVFSTYASDYRDYSPYFTDPNVEITKVVCQSQGYQAEGRYFDVSGLWPTALADGYYNGVRTSKVFTDALAPQSASLWYQRVFVAAPEYWNRITRLRDSSQWGATKVSDVHFPSRKVWVSSDFHANRPAQDDATQQTPGASILFGCVDGHAPRIDADKLGEEYHVASGTLFPLVRRTRLYTVDGVRGRDFQ